MDNFYYSLDNAQTPYFMWLGGHDVLPQNYVEELINALIKNKKAVLAFTHFDFIDNHSNFIRQYTYNYIKDLISENPFERIFSLIKNLDYCTLFHGIFKTEILRKSKIEKWVLGGDHVILCKAISYGKFICIENSKFLRRDAHANETETERIYRQTVIISNNEIKENLSNPHKEMQEEQLAILKNKFTFRFLYKKKLIKKAELILIERFGKF